MEIFIIFLLILINGIFAMSEIAMVSSKKIRLEKSAKKGDIMAKKALQLSRNPGKFLSTVQIGITLIGILTGIYSGKKIEDDVQTFLNNFQLLRPYSETLSFALIVVVLTYFSLVIGELVPKRIGLTMPETVSKILAYPMYVISLIAAPFIWLLTFTSDVIMKIINIKKPKESYVTEEEIKAIVQEGMETGVVQEIEQDIVENVFYLGDRKVKTLMTPRHDIEWIDMNDSDDKIKKKIISSSHKSFPVAQGDVNKMKGMLHSKEILNTLLQRNYFDIKQSLKPVFYLSENTTAYKALEKMRENKERVSLIVNEFGDVQGILSMNDLVNALVGDFAEQLHESREIIPRDDGSFLVDAALPFAEFTRYFEIDIEGDESVENINSVGGFLFHQANAIPKTGFKIQWKNLELEIIDMDRRRIDKVLVKRREDL